MSGCVGGWVDGGGRLGRGGEGCAQGLKGGFSSPKEIAILGKSPGAFPGEFPVHFQANFRVNFQ